MLGRAASNGQRVILTYDVARRQAIWRLITRNRDDACTTFGDTSIEDLIDFIDRRFAAAGT